MIGPHGRVRQALDPNIAGSKRHNAFDDGPEIRMIQHHHIADSDVVVISQSRRDGVVPVLEGRRHAMAPNAQQAPAKRHRI